MKFNIIIFISLLSIISCAHNGGRNLASDHSDEEQRLRSITHIFAQPHTQINPYNPMAKYIEDLTDAGYLPNENIEDGFKKEELTQLEDDQVAFQKIEKKLHKNFCRAEQCIAFEQKITFTSKFEVNLNFESYAQKTIAAEFTDVKIKLKMISPLNFLGKRESVTLYESEFKKVLSEQELLKILTEAKQNRTYSHRPEIR